MVSDVDKKDLELFLEKTPTYTRPKEWLEQYPTPSDAAATLLWEAYMNGDIAGKTIADLGCGTLRLGLGALFLGASRVVGVDIDAEALEDALSYLSANHNYYARTVLVNSDARLFDGRGIDTVIMNPPFGVKKTTRGLDVEFLEAAARYASSIYSIHKYSVGLERIVEEIAARYGFSVRAIRYLLPIKMMYPRHRRKVYRVAVALYILRRR